ncbi:MAG TPA: VWA domain-containing protein [Bryobacteraceae bacterium]|jgi:VWFA-related protein|nr:VWA domain-containing protein [Bryobacteraceae bacterium]
MQRRDLLLSALVFIPASRLVRAQQSVPPSPGQVQPQGSPAPPTFSTDVKVVNVFATVRDKDGHIVTNLTKDDFTLLEDGRPQTIRYFAQQSNLPLTIGLLVDTSGSERRMLSTERQASYTFLEQVLRPEKDKAFLIHFDREVELLQDVTPSRERLEKALDLLDTPQFANANNGPNNGGGGNGGGWPGGGGGGGWGGRGGGGRHGGGAGHRGGGTTFYDAIYLASDQVMSAQSGRKALIMLTDGEDNGSKVSLEESISSANRASTMAYAVRIADEEQSAFNPGFGGPGMGRHGGYGGRGGGMERPDGKKILKQIAKETGGGYFEVSKKKTVSDIYSSIEEELRNQYSIGYTSGNTTGDNNFRKIELTVDKKNLIVQARNGYYPRISNAS